MEYVAFPAAQQPGEAGFVLYSMIPLDLYRRAFEEHQRRQQFREYQRQYAYRSEYMARVRAQQRYQEQQEEFLRQMAAEAERRENSDRPTKESVLSRLPTFQFSRTTIQILAAHGFLSADEEYSAVCPICFDDFSSVLGGTAASNEEDEGGSTGAFCTYLPCGHIFHHVCLFEWLQRRHSCPVCRFDLPCFNDSNWEYRNRVSKRLGESSMIPEAAVGVPVRPAQSPHDAGELLLQLIENNLTLFRVLLHVMCYRGWGGLSDQEDEESLSERRKLKDLTGCLLAMLLDLDRMPVDKFPSWPDLAKRRKSMVLRVQFVEKWIDDLLGNGCRMVVQAQMVS